MRSFKAYWTHWSLIQAIRTPKYFLQERLHYTLKKVNFGIKSTWWIFGEEKTLYLWFVNNFKSFEELINVISDRIPLKNCYFCVTVDNVDQSLQLLVNFNEWVTKVTQKASRKVLTKIPSLYIESELENNLWSKASSP